MKKTCFKCKQEKELELFYKHPDMPDGRVNKCKECNKIDNRPSSGNINRNCLECNKTFRTNISEIKAGGGLVCSRDCFFLRFRKIVKRENNSPNWKGDKVGKNALHDWVKKNLGKPMKCEHCKTTQAKKFEWANKSQEYKRELTDWIRLCTKCHCAYDKPTRYPKYIKTINKKKNLCNHLKN